MKSKNKHYGFPYNYDSQKPIHKFVSPSNTNVYTFYKEGVKYAMLQKSEQGQQRVLLDDLGFSNMLTFLDRNGWNEISA